MNPASEQEKKTGKLISQLNHPVTITYAGEVMTLSPREPVKNVVRERLGSLPKGVIFVARND